MTWFRVDDGFYSHDKTIRIPRRLRAEAAGTWLLCGTWSADKERDGFVPEHIVDEVGGTLEGAAALVEAGLWRRRRGGFVFVNWAEFQPTREQLLERRQSETKRKAEYRARKARELGAASANVPTGHARDDNTPSRPVPDDDVTSEIGHPYVSSGPRRDDLSTGLSPLVESVARAVAEHCGRTLHPLVVPDLVEWLDGRRGPRAAPLQNPTRYYPKAIATSAFEVQQFIDERGLAS